MKNLPTAEELLRDKYKLEGDRGTLRIDQVSMFMIEFAKLHTERALQKANKNARISITENENPEKLAIGWGRTFNGESLSVSIDKHSITNAYPLENIK